MKRGALLALALACAACAPRYANFTLPPMSGGDTALTFRFDEYPEPVLSDPEGDALNPSVARDAGYTNLYSVYHRPSWLTMRARSTDGLRWETPRPFLAPNPQSWEAGYIAANGTALLAGSSLFYWYVAGPRNAASIGFTRNGHKQAQPVLAHGPFESWDERAVADPYVIFVHPYYYMYYLGQDRAQPPRQRLGMARSSDGVRWTKSLANPILAPGPPGAFDEAGAGEPAVWQSQNFYWMLYTGRDFSERRRLGLARSTDGVHWTKLPAVFSGASAWDSQVICDPTVLLDGGEIKVWFGGGDVASPDENLHGKIGFATLRPIYAEAR
jgi:predicted GH43/DUF377 family glycosyl hydrolase